MQESGVSLDGVLRHFPQQEDLVRDLARGNPDFRDMCDELGLAEDALARVGSLPVLQRAERLAECQGWIDRLLCEMRAVLAAANVVVLRRPAPGPRP